ncbi:MAG: hypothetical protein U1F26_01515 [Lysobacterales bacterium]
MEQELVARATRIYARACEREGSVYQQPGNAESCFDQKAQTVTLANARGTLAVYRYRRTTDRFSRAEIDVTGARK